MVSRTSKGVGVPFNADSAFSLNEPNARQASLHNFIE